MMNKISKEQTFMKMALSMASLSKCVSHQVCSLIVKDGRIISTGINGTFNGRINCCDYAKEQGWLGDDGLLIPEFRPLHSEWSLKNEVHAEINAISSAAKFGISTEESEMYCTLAPCINCAKSIAASGIKKLFYLHEYYNTNTYANPDWKNVLEESGIEVIKVDL